MKQLKPYFYHFRLTATYIVDGNTKQTDLGGLLIQGSYMVRDGVVTIDSYTYDTAIGTSLNNFIEWLKAGGDYSEIETAAEEHCKYLFEQQNAA